MLKIFTANQIKYNLFFEFEVFLHSNMQKSKALAEAYIFIYILSNFYQNLDISKVVTN